MKEYYEIGEIGQIITGNTPSTSEARNYNSNDINFYKPGDLDKEEIKILDESECYISNYAEKTARIVPAGSVLVTCIGIIGKIGITTKKSSFNQQINAIIPNGNINEKYLAYAISSIREQLSLKANAPIVPQINKTAFSKFKIPIYELPKQQLIVSELDIINKAISNRKHNIKELDNLINSMVNKALNSNTKKYQKLSDITEKITKGTTPTTIGSNFAQSGINFIKIESIGLDGEFLKSKFMYIDEDCNRKLERSQLKENDILFSIAGAIGRVAIVTKEILPANTNQALAIIRLNKKINPLYVKLLLQTSFCQNQLLSKKQGVAQINVSLKDISNLLIPIVDESLQEEIVNKVQKIHLQKKLLQQDITDLNLILEIKMHEYFN